MARKMTEWPSKRGPITKIMPSDGCIGDTVPLAVGKWYDFHEFGWYMGNVGSSEDKSNYKLILPGDIGYNTMRMWQGVSGLSSLRGIVSPAYTVCIPKPDLLDGEFAAYLFKLPRMIFQFWRYCQGLVDDTLSLKFPNFSHITIHLPDTTTQHNIVTIIKARDTELEKLYRLKSRYHRQKLGLMQMLLTGKWRVRLGVSDEWMFNGVGEW